MKKRFLFRSFSLLITLAFLFTNYAPTFSAFSGGINVYQSSYNELNLLILVRASQSSSHKLSTLSYSKNRLEIIQEAIPLVLEQHSFPSNINLGIMAFGHHLDQTDYEPSCSTENVEMVVPFQLASDRKDFTRFNEIQGSGYSPTFLALEEAGKLFPPASDEVLNVILLIADGSDTCTQNPAVKARELAENKNVVIHTIGFMADTKGDKELNAIANQTSGQYQFISPYIDDNEVATNELTKALLNVFDSLLAQISTPIPANTVTLTETASLTPAPTSTSIPTSTPTETPTQALPESTLPEPTSTKGPSYPSPSIGIVVASAIFVVAILAVGLLFWRSRRATKTIERPTEPEITADERLEQFRKDLFKAYFSIEAKKHHPKYIPLEQVREELSSKYPKAQFDDLLAQARRKYPNNIWIDRDATNQPLYIKIKK